MSWLVTLARWLCPNYFKEAKLTQKAQVITIAFSHYCELACWSLKYAKIPFVERGFAPGQHVLPALSVRVGQDNKKYISGSSRTTSVKEESLKSENLTEEEKLRAKKRDASARATAVPFAVMPNGKVLLDSWEIAEYAFPNDQVDDELKRLLDNEIGPLSRRAVYCHILQPHNRSFFDKLCMTGRGWFIRLLWSTFLGNMLLKTMGKMFNVKDAASVQKCREDLIAASTKLEKFLDQRQGRYISGDYIGLADIAVASLFAPLVSPPLYCAGRYEAVFNELMLHDPEIRKDTEFWRNTKVGRYVLDVYENHRLH